jgi:hypothetical protein
MRTTYKTLLATLFYYCVGVLGALPGNGSTSTLLNVLYGEAEINSALKVNIEESVQYSKINPA